MRRWTGGKGGQSVCECEGGGCLTKAKLWRKSRVRTLSYGRAGWSVWEETPPDDVAGQLTVKKCPIDNFLFGPLQGKVASRRIVCTACGAEASRRGEEKWWAWHFVFHKNIRGLATDWLSCQQIEENKPSRVSAVFYVWIWLHLKTQNKPDDWFMPERQWRFSSVMKTQLATINSSTLFNAWSSKAVPLYHATPQWLTVDIVSFFLQCCTRYNRNIKNILI